MNNINLGARWLSNYSEYARLRLPQAVSRDQVVQVEFSTTFSGGISGDNWDVKRIVVEAYEGSRRVLLAERPMFTRFTGSNRSVRLGVKNASAAAPAPEKIVGLQLRITTGGDDLRGNNDNVNATILFRDGSRQFVPTINARQRWKDHTTKTIDLRLDRPRDHNEIVGIMLETTSRGGIGGDNWNMDSLSVTPHASDGERPRYYSRSGKPLNRFTGSQPRFTARW